MPRTFISGGNIRVCRFVEPGANTDGTTDFTVTEANGANDKVWGIAQGGTRAAPLDGVTAYAAISGDPIEVFMPGEECLLELGGTVADGAYLATTNAGLGVTASTDETYCARALEAGISGDRIRVRVMHGSTESS